MKLTKKLEAEILKAYHTTVDANLSGDMRTFASMLDENCHVIGTAESEVFRNKKAAVKFYSAAAGQITGKVRFQNRKISVMTIDNEVMVNEKLDFYVLIDNQFTFYGPARVSCLFHKKNNQWKVIHMHGSFPDSKADEGEQVNTDKIKAENIKLRDAVKRRTVELESKNKELQIEAALERVRTIAMGMKKAEDMLLICKTISQQLKKLGIKEIRNVQTAIVYPNRGTYLNYEFYAKHNKVFTTEVLYINHPMSRAFVKKMLDGPNEFFKRSLSAKKTKEWYAFQKTTNQFADKYLLTASSLNYYWYSLGAVALGISTYEALSKEEQELFVRFRNVFELSYRRFLDIQKAEAQARESQIQLALERVRARTMAMQNSDELAEVSFLLNKQVVELGIPTRGCAFNIYGENESTEWFSNLEGTMPAYETPRENIFLKYYKAGKRGETTLIEEYAGKKIKDHYQYMFKAGIFGNDITEEKIKQITPEFQIDHVAYFKYGYLLFITLVPAPDAHDVFKRFAKEFEQTYTRFLDLQKAEAQAREAKIEVALEKVRSRAMAMQKPAELVEVAQLLRSEMGLLGVEELETSSIYIHNEPTQQTECWYAIQKENKLVSDHMIIHLQDTWVGREMLAFYNSGEKKTSIVMKGENRKEWINYCADHSEVLMNFYGDIIPDRTYHLYKFSNGFMGAASPGDISAESWNLLQRATAVFSLAYTRFSDLQQAEAQAREAKIEAALERVRSRSMAMQKSDELKEVIRLVLEQFVHLKINAEHAGFYIDYKAHDDMHIWLADPNIEPFFAIIPYFDTTTWNSFLEAKAKSTAFHTDLLDFKEKNKFYKSLFKLFLQ
ncbi:MAG: nuclear transport factor 2 family protein [Sphingobacteriales bacterium]|nr:nuclear transport factor 2 family protein [Sphingobacteriales bacterium]